MRLFKKNPPTQEDNELTTLCHQEAEALYRSGSHHCAEAVFETIRRYFAPDTPESAVGLVSGFGGGSGSGCLCGAVSGASVALGLVLQDKKRSMKLTRELHSWFREQYSVTCCTAIRANNQSGICAVLTGRVAAKTAEMLSSR